MVVFVVSLLLFEEPLPHLNLFRVEASTASGLANLNESPNSDGEPITLAVARGERPAFPPPVDVVVRFESRLALLGE